MAERTRSARAGRSASCTSAVDPRLLARKGPGSILTEEEVGLVSDATVDFLRRNFPVSPSSLFDRASIERITRYHAVALRLSAARTSVGKTIQEMAKVLKVAQYKLRALEGSATGSIDPELLRRYAAHLGVQPWLGRWIRANRKLAVQLRLVPE
jgi:hypothetical protein